MQDVLSVGARLPTERFLYEFEGFVLDPVRRLLTQQGTVVPLPPKALATLAVLVERRGQVVEKEELFQLIWPDTFITEATLTQNVFRLRKALGEEAGEHRFIVTVPGRGYCFVAEVRRVEAAQPSSSDEPPAEEPPLPEESLDDPTIALDPAGSAPAEPPLPAPLPTPLPAAPTGKLRRRLLRTAAVLALAGLAGSLAFTWVHRPAPKAPKADLGARPARRSVAVLGFRNLSRRQETAWLSTALSEMFRSELAVGDQLHTITGESVTRARRDLELAEVDSLSPETLARLRRLLGCDVILLGSYLILNGDEGHQIRVDLRLQDTENGEMLTALTGTRTEKDLFNLVSELGQDLRLRLGSRRTEGKEAVSTRAAFPVSRLAARRYAEGLQRQRSLDTLAAVELLRQATQAEPEFPLAHAALASAWATLGYDRNARDEAAKALELATHLSREERLLVEALHFETRSNWVKAAEIYESLWRFFPDDPEYGLRLARAKVKAGRAQDALQTVGGLRKLAPPAADDPRIDLAESEAAAALSDYSRQETAATRAAAKGRDLGARLLTAQALHLQGQALRSLGRQEQALARFEEAERIFRAAGDHVGVGSALHDMGNLLRDRGDFAGARARYEQALEIHRQAGNQDGIVLALTNLGGLELQRGDYQAAQPLLLRVVDTARQVHDPVGEARGRSSLASILQEQGRLAEARQSFLAALELFRATGSLQGEAGVRASLSMVLLDLGSLPAARRQVEQALALSRKIGHSRIHGYALRQLGMLLIEEGHLVEAQTAFREMQRVAEQTGHKQLLADAMGGQSQIQRLQGNIQLAREHATRALVLWTEAVELQRVARGHIALARLALDAGDPATAEKEARTALDRFRAFRLPEGEALAHEALATIFLARQDATSADREIRLAQGLTKTSQDRRIRLAIAITAGRIRGAMGQLGEARRILAQAHKEGTTLGMPFSALDAELALAEIDRRQNRPGASANLQGLRDQATRRGFLLLARRAAPEAPTSPR